MKAIVEVAPRGSAIKNARAQLVSRGKDKIDFHLSFESARSLFS